MTVWGHVRKTNLNPLVVLHKRIIRMLGGLAARDHTEQVFVDLKPTSYQLNVRITDFYFLFSVI